MVYVMPRSSRGNQQLAAASLAAMQQYVALCNKKNIPITGSKLVAQIFGVYGKAQQTITITQTKAILFAYINGQEAGVAANDRQRLIRESLIYLASIRDVQAKRRNRPRSRHTAAAQPPQPLWPKPTTARMSLQRCTT